MPFVTTLTLESGDRELLDAVVDGFKERAKRKGIEIKGPHSHPPRTLRVPLHRGLTEHDGQFEPWEYTVYERTVEITGHDETVRSVTDWEFPRGVHVEVEISQVRSVGSR